MRYPCCYFLKSIVGISRATANKNEVAVEQEACADADAPFDERGNVFVGRNKAFDDASDDENGDAADDELNGRLTIA